jgi:cytochrome P450
MLPLIFHVHIKHNFNSFLGQKFAMYEMKALMGTVIQRFKISSVTKREDIVLIADVILRTEDPVKIKLTLRNDKKIN